MTEIVAPAGNFSKLKTAILYGADAVYFSGQRYGLRMGADNFSLDEITKGVEHCHEHHRKAYITINAYLQDQDFEHLLDYLHFLDSLKVDAVICSDLGVVELVKKHTNIPVHLSTQAFVLNSWHASIWKKIGVKRIVLGRELSILQAAQIKKSTAIEVELFIHGAMCMSYSGHCTISNYTAGRDSNRGGCIQSCRHIYSSKDIGQAQTLLSSKDLNGSVYFQELVTHGINAAKIEGRMKSELYLATTVRSYSNLRKLAQKSRLVSLSWELELDKLPHRGYTTASLRKKAGLSSVYDGTATKDSQYKFLGFVVFYHKQQKRLFLHCKNPVRNNMKVEILGIKENFLLTLRELQNANGEKIELAQADTLISFFATLDLQKGLIARFLTPSKTLVQVV